MSKGAGIFCFGGRPHGPERQSGFGSITIDLILVVFAKVMMLSTATARQQAEIAQVATLFTYCVSLLGT